MSQTTIAVAHSAGLVKDHDFQNSWGSGAYVWDRLSDRYQIPGGHFFRWQNLWKYHSNNELEPFEHNTIITTYDRYVVERDAMLLIAESFERFVEAYPPDGRVCSLAAQAQVIREAHANGAEFLAWSQTSVSDPWFEIRDPETDTHHRYDPHVGDNHTVADVKPLASDTP